MSLLKTDFEDLSFKMTLMNMYIIIFIHYYTSTDSFINETLMVSAEQNVIILFSCAVHMNSLL